jgi:hypothetical protein
MPCAAAGTGPTERAKRPPVARNPLLLAVLPVLLLPLFYYMQDER